jgi:hypothetical protein
MYIYVLPTQEKMPPRALLYDELPVTLMSEGETILTAGVGMAVTWSNDMGVWVGSDGIPLPPEVGEVITEHARSLGVDL